MPTPSVGRPVHFVPFGTPIGEYSQTCQHATITEVDPDDLDLVGLAVFPPHGPVVFKPIHGGRADRPGGGCRYQDPESRMSGPEGDTWHWPERVGD